jgi:hypothetical protein
VVDNVALGVRDPYLRDHLVGARAVQVELSHAHVEDALVVDEGVLEEVVAGEDRVCPPLVIELFGPGEVFHGGGSGTALTKSSHGCKW